MSNSRIIDAFRFASHLSFRKILNAMKIKMSYYYSVFSRNVISWGFPYSMSIEPTTNCNLKCLECPSGLRDLKRKGGNIEMDQFSHILEEVHPYLMSLILYFQGEPLMHSDFTALVKKAKEKKIYTITSTNAHFLDDENCKALINCGLDRLIISYDGTSQDTYSGYRAGGRLEKVEAGIGNLIKWKQKLKKSNPYIILQFLVLGTNETQIDEAKQKAKKWKLPIQLKSAQVYDFENNSFLIPKNDKYSRYKKDADGNFVIKGELHNRCFRMWSGAVVTWDGKVVPCCFDKDAEHVMGNLKQKSFKEIWISKSYNSFRKNVFTDRKWIGICGNCTE